MKKTIELTLVAMFKIQSAVHTLEDIDQKNDFKGMQKKNLNDFLNACERFIKTHDIILNELTMQVAGSESQNYVDCVKMFDDLGEQITVDV